MQLVKLVAQRAKHRTSVAVKRLRWRLQLAGAPVLDGPFRRYQRAFPKSFHGSPTGSFLDLSAEGDHLHTSTPHVLWVFWTGDNEMSANRLRSLDQVRAIQVGAEVRLITPSNLSSVVVPGHPLHSAYPYLSYVHRADYLRAYVLRHHGGAYTDLKRPFQSWLPLLIEFDRQPDAWLWGYNEIKFDMVPDVRRTIGFDLRRVSDQMIGHGAYLAKAGTPLAVEWLDEVERRLTYYGDLLRRTPGNAIGNNIGYPIRWTELLAEVLSPLVFKYREHVVMDDRIRVSLTDYQ